MTKLVIVNTGCANISSLKFAVERLGFAVTISEDQQEISNADKVFLPGVGAAAAAMEQIQSKNLESCLTSLTQPVLGICLGMQLLTRQSEEGAAKCLGVVDTEVKAMRSETLRLPHMGWNQVNVEKDNLLFDGISDGTYFYFVHGFCVQTGEHTLASCDYTHPFSAAICQNNFQGVQFHPERSGEAGAQLIKNFIEKV